MANVDVYSMEATNGDNLKFRDDSALHTILDESGTEYPHRNKIQFINADIEDDAENDRTIISGSGGGGVALSDVSGTAISSSMREISIRWTDPEDITIDGQTISTWGGTLVVRKAGSAPADRRDGTVILDSKTRNAYASTAFVDNTVDYGNTYYYRFFPYTIGKLYTDGSSVSIAPTRVVIQNVPSQNGTLTYDGTDQEPVWSNYDSTQLDISGDVDGTNADTYTAIFTPKYDYTWSDGRSAKNVSWSIAKLSFATPVQSGSLVYDGTEQTATFMGFDTDYMTVSGNKGTVVDTYTATFTLTDTDNTKWDNSQTATITATWVINDATVAIPTVTNTSKTYNGSEQSPTISTYDTSLIEVTGNTATNAGNYTVTMHLKNANYKWSDGTTSDKTAAWSISAKTVSIPSVSGSFTYAPSTTRNATISSFSTDEITQTGTASATNAGTYTVYFDLTNTNNYVWSDGTTTQKSGTWAIARAEQTLSVSSSHMVNNTITLNASLMYDDVTVTHTTGDGTISTSSSNPSYVKAEMSSGKVRITAIESGTATITVTAAQTTNYNSKSVTFSAVAELLPADINDATWAQISQASASGKAASTWSVGDTKAVTLNGSIGAGLTLSNKTLYVYILGFDHNSSVEGNGISFGCFKDAKTNGNDVCLIDDAYNTNVGYSGTKKFALNHWGSSSSPYNTNYGGWAACDARYDILGSTNQAPTPYGSTKTTSATGNNPTSTCATSPVSNTLMAAFSSDLRAVMKPITKYTDNKGNSSNVAGNVTATIDYLPLRSEFEVQGARTYANEYEKNSQAQYQYYKNGNSKIKMGYNASGLRSASGWWCRSTYYSYAYRFCGVGTDGGANYCYSRLSLGLAPAFLV